ncbi:MAG: rhomboid family intramembrane serine protease [Hydrogenophaga sp.]|uniref:rhomboid family intramembrane serine protease n=1 Tax=Hydrogenophaga sp. TaxID=1904254 RepID=UPI002617B838|nr:rhomboid family intramembrane serine protease [Hydrogenophaga sp.]MCV0438584.1 rhomboid family intramembrane serine protease [Hydrogenophaga sp.]
MSRGAAGTAATYSWLLLCCVHGAASMLLWWWGDGAAQALTWNAADWPARPWTLWTSAWVHLNTQHLVGNQLALGALVAFGWMVRPDLRCTTAWLLAWPLNQISLLLWPQIGSAVGLSGLLHAGTMVLAVQIALDRIPIRGARFWGGLLALGALTKVVLEGGWLRPMVWDASHSMLVVQAAHLTGVLWGLLLGLAAAWRFRPPRARPPRATSGTG